MADILLSAINFFHWNVLWSNTRKRAQLGLPEALVQHQSLNISPFVEQPDITIPAEAINILPLLQRRLCILPTAKDIPLWHEERKHAQLFLKQADQAKYELLQSCYFPARIEGGFIIIQLLTNILLPVWITSSNFGCSFLKIETDTINNVSVSRVYILTHFQRNFIPLFDSLMEGKMSHYALSYLRTGSLIQIIDIFKDMVWIIAFQRKAERAFRQSQML